MLVGEAVAKRALDAHGWSEIEITGKHYILVGFQGCGQDDAAKFDAVALNPIGKRVKLYVCTGLMFKGATIRVQ